MVAHDVVVRLLVSDDPTWEEAEAAEAHVEDDSASAVPTTREILRRTISSPSILVRYAVLPRSALSRNKRSGVDQTLAAARPLCTPRRWPCRRCRTWAD